jgi:hypothetical protein
VVVVSVAVVVVVVAAADKFCDSYYSAFCILMQKLHHCKI